MRTSRISSWPSQRYEQLYFCASSCEADLPVPIAQIGSYAITVEKRLCSAVNLQEQLRNELFCCFYQLRKFQGFHHNEWLGFIPGFAKIACFLLISSSVSWSSHDVHRSDRCFALSGTDFFQNLWASFTSGIFKVSVFGDAALRNLNASGSKYSCLKSTAGCDTSCKGQLKEIWCYSFSAAIMVLRDISHTSFSNFMLSILP